MWTFDKNYPKGKARGGRIGFKQGGAYGPLRGTTAGGVAKAFRGKAGFKESQALQKKLKKKSDYRLKNELKRIQKMPDKKFKTGKELKREKKMGGGMTGRRFGMKKGSKFPDLTGDGKVTFADILKGRGVINGKKKKK